MNAKILSLLTAALAVTSLAHPVVAEPWEWSCRYRTTR
jgi:hypothetical protein